MTKPGYADINIRGQMGHQIFEALSGMGAALDAGHVPHLLTCNIGGSVDRFRLHDLFQVNIPVRTITGFGKSHAWSENGLVALFGWREFILKNQLIFKAPALDKTANGVWLQVRGTDKAFTTKEQYVEIASQLCEQYPSITICGDDKEYVMYITDRLVEQKHENFNLSSANDVDDWYNLYYADIVYCGISSFALSTALVNPYKDIRLFPKKFTVREPLAGLKPLDIWFENTETRYAPDLK